MEYYQQMQNKIGVKLDQPEVPADADVQAYDAMHKRVRAEVAAGQSVSLKSYVASRKPKAKRVK
jgi:hypothetical protein